MKDHYVIKYKNVSVFQKLKYIKFSYYSKITPDISTTKVYNSGICLHGDYRNIFMHVYSLQLKFMKSSISPFTSMFEKLKGLYVSHPYILFWSLPVYFPWSFFKITRFLMSKCYALLLSHFSCMYSAVESHIN